jgi:thiol-disulfide isomerase/thioredoxin
MHPAVDARRRRCLTLLAGTALPGLVRAATAGPQARPWPAGRLTPMLDLPRLDGGRWRLDEARGRPVLLNFWATWCPPCRDELPSLELLAERHTAEGLQVVTIDYREPPAAIQRFLDQWPMSLPILRDVDGEVARAWGVRVFPTSVLIGRDGRPRWTLYGELDWGAPALRDWLAPQLR